MAFTLLRLMTVFLAIAMIHLSSGLMLEAREYDSGSEEPSGKESLTFRAARIIGTLTLIVFCIYLTCKKVGAVCQGIRNKSGNASTPRRGRDHLRAVLHR